MKGSAPGLCPACNFIYFNSLEKQEKRVESVSGITHIFDQNPTHVYVDGNGARIDKTVQSRDDFGFIIS